jgi:hypothetical protein
VGRLIDVLKRPTRKGHALTSTRGKDAHG